MPPAGEGIGEALAGERRRQEEPAPILCKTGALL